MVVIELKYKKSLAMVNDYLDAHRAFLQKYYGEGIFVMSGPKHPRNGGIIIAAVDFQAACEIIKDDPFYQAQIAEYNVMEFDASKSLKQAHMSQAA